MGVELGAELATVLQRKYPAAWVGVVVAAFEDWPVPEEPFDVVAAFTAWHWLDLPCALKVAALLRPGGALATVTTTHVRGSSNAFFEQAHRCYERWDPSTPTGIESLASDAVPPALDEVDDTPVFAPAIRRRYGQDVTYSTRGYLEVLGTYSGHRALPPAQREGLFACIGDLIDRRHGGMVTKRYLYELRVAQLGPVP